MKKMLVTALFFLVAGSLASPAQAFRWKKIAKKLSLSATQVSQIKKIVYKTRREQIMLRAKLQMAQLDLKQLLDQHKPDAEKVSKAVDKVGQFEIEMKKKNILMLVQIKSLLTAKQAERLEEHERQKRLRRRRLRRRFKRWIKGKRRRPTSR